MVGREMSSWMWSSSVRCSISPEGARVLGVIGASRCNVLISGGTGSGKTTLLNMLTAFIDPTTPKDTLPRESIEIRTAAFFD